MSCEEFRPSAIQFIKVRNAELTLVYRNRSRVSLEFSNPGEMDIFIHSLIERIENREPELAFWN